MNRLFMVLGAVLLASLRLPGQITGTEIPEFAALDRDIPALMAAAHVPGGAIALVKDGRLVYARGYGVADVARGEAFQPDTLSRIGSISKTVTSAALLKLYEGGRLDLDARVFPEILTQLQPAPGMAVDPRLKDISVRQLLHHTGGHGRDTGTDPLNAGPVVSAAEALHVALPPGYEGLVRYAMGLPLDFDPGTKYSYSNYGFLVLARVVERIAGERYEDFVRQQVLAPTGVRRMALGGNLPEPGEAHYYDAPRAPLELPLYPDSRHLLPAPYANFEVLASDGSGRWVGSAIDLARFAAHLEGSRTPQILLPSTFQTMLEKPSPFVSADPSGGSWYGMGTLVIPGNGFQVWGHGGAYPGAVALIESLGNGYVFAYVFNSMPGNTTFQNAVGAMLFKLNDSVRNWPTNDLFPRYYPEN